VSLAAAISRQDVPALAATFAAADEFIMVADFWPEIAGQVQVDELRAHVRRSDLPWVSKGGMVPSLILRSLASPLAQLYYEPTFSQFLSAVTGKQLRTRTVGNEHSFALYWYDEPGDGMEYHYDDCSAATNANYTVLLGLQNSSTQLLRCNVSGRQVDVALAPGTLVIFCGSKVRHGVTALPPNQQRVVFSMRYLANSNSPLTFGERIRDRFAQIGITSDEFASDRAFGSILTLRSSLARVSAGFVVPRWWLPYLFLKVGQRTIELPPRRFAGASAAR
jgi:hypothetical protein